MAALLSGLATLILAVIISFDVLMRYFFNQPQLIVDEVGPYLLLIVIFGAAAQTFRVGGHIRVDLVTAYLPRPARGWLPALDAHAPDSRRPLPHGPVHGRDPAPTAPGRPRPAAQAR